MRIIKEEVDTDYFIDIVLSFTELRAIKDYMVLAEEVQVGDKIFNIGVRCLMKDELETDIA